MDEPCSALDPISTMKIEELASELKSRYTIVGHVQYAAGRPRIGLRLFPEREAHRMRRYGRHFYQTCALSRHHRSRFGWEVRAWRLKRHDRNTYDLEILR